MDSKNTRIKNYGQKFTLRLIKELARRQPVTRMINRSDCDGQCGNAVRDTIRLFATEKRVVLS